MQALTDTRPYSLTLAYAATSRDGADRRAGQVALRVAVAREVGVDARRVRIRRRAGSPPAIALKNPSTECHDVVVSLSHRDGRAAAVASTRVTAIGVDLERLSSIDPAHTRYFLRPDERRLLQRYSASELWALKESAWKALGLAGDIAFARLSLAMSSDLVIDGVVFDSRHEPANVIVTHPSPGWVLTVLWIPGRAA